MTIIVLCCVASGLLGFIIARIFYMPHEVVSKNVVIVATNDGKVLLCLHARGHGYMMSRKGAQDIGVGLVKMAAVIPGRD